jgi:deoxyribonuclease V
VSAFDITARSAAARGAPLPNHIMSQGRSMHIPPDYDWDLSRDDAQRLHQSLAQQVSRVDDFSPLTTVAGIHLSYPRQPGGGILGMAAVVVLRLPDLTVLETQIAVRAVTFPYVAELLSFRETPIALQALRMVNTQPDLLLVSSPSMTAVGSLGSASHLGVLLDVPSIGCAETVPAGLNTGEGSAMSPPLAPGDWSPLRADTEAIKQAFGAAVRTSRRGRPVFVTAGHRISLETAVATVMRCVRGSRLPEPLRLAQWHSRQARVTTEGEA